MFTAIEWALRQRGGVTVSVSVDKPYEGGRGVDDLNMLVSRGRSPQGPRGAAVRMTCTHA